MNLKTNGGFSLVQVMVSTALMAVLAATGAKVLADLSKNARTIDSKNLTLSANQGLQVFLANERVCSQSMSPFQLNASLASDMEFNIAGLGRFAKGHYNQEMSLVTTKLHIGNLVNSETNMLGMKIYIGSLKISFERKHGATNQTFKELPVGAMSLMADSSGRVLKCVLGKMTFNEVNQDLAADPDVPVVTAPGNSGGNGGIAEYPPPVNTNAGGGSQVASQSTSSGTQGDLLNRKCSSIEQCAVYDYFLRNGFPNALQSADTWMGETSGWNTIARGYIDSMSVLGKLNFMASANQAGLIQTGHTVNQAGGKRTDSLDQWVSDAVSKDPSGRSMLTTSEGLKTLKVLFDSDSSSSNTKSILRTALTQSPDLTLNSSLGIGAWVNALGYSSAAEMAKAHPAASINAALNPGAGKDPQGLKEVVMYMQQNPAQAVEIANGTGLWAKNVSGGVDTVVKYITTGLTASGNNQAAMDIAAATSQWQRAIGSQAVGSAIQANSDYALSVASGTAQWNQAVGANNVSNFMSQNSASTTAAIARGTAAATEIFGAGEVKSFIQNNTADAMKGAAAIDAAKSAGYSDAQIKDYIQNNPSSWQNWTSGK